MIEATVAARRYELRLVAVACCDCCERVEVQFRVDVNTMWSREPTGSLDNGRGPAVFNAGQFGDVELGIL